MDEEVLHSPRLLDSPSSLTPTTPIREMFNKEDDCACFSDTDNVVDLTEPEPPTIKKKKLTAYFQPVSTSMNQMPYFLQRYNPQPGRSPQRREATATPASKDSGSSKSTSNQSTNITKGKAKQSAFNKTYSIARKLEVVKYVKNHSETEAAHHFGIPRTTLREWKDLDKRPVERTSSSKKGKNKASWSWTPSIIQPGSRSTTLPMGLGDEGSARPCASKSNPTASPGNYPTVQHFL